MAYDTGNPELDATITELVAAASANDNADLIAEIVTTALKLHRDGAPRGDLKLVNTALKEIRYSMLVFSRHSEPKVTMYGSARLAPDTLEVGSARCGLRFHDAGALVAVRCGSQQPIVNTLFSFPPLAPGIDVYQDGRILAGYTFADHEECRRNLSEILSTYLT